ncbi:MAG TPA: hypothetical protein VGN95_19020 [Pyrinomonadaceae bacterium]|jgi:FAD/FMN-containing dehydrogenase|nr:hypothetical protein [Pyrinomonadaceae bacterium]
MDCSTALSALPIRDAASLIVDVLAGYYMARTFIAISGTTGVLSSNTFRLHKSKKYARPALAIVLYKASYWRVVNATHS